MKYSFLSLILLGAAIGSLHSESELPAAKIKVQLKVASNYISKGADKFTNRALQKKQSYGSNTGAPVFIPSITYQPPIKGAFYKFQAFMALEGRQDTDSDGFIQQGPGGSNLLYGIGSSEQQIQAIQNTSGLLNSAGQFAGLASAFNGPLAYPACKSTTSCLPDLYKEENGLFRQEQIKQFIGYGRKTSVGKVLFSLLYVSPLDKRTGLDTFQAIIFEYSLPNLEQLLLSTEHGLPQSSNYYQLKWVDKYPITRLNQENLLLKYSAGVAYGVEDHLHGIKDVTGRLGLAYQGLSIGASIAWRPDLRFFDKDNSGIGSDHVPVWLAGNSSRRDGEAADPARLYGYENEIINRTIQTFLQANGLVSNYTYIPRQKLPRYIYWVDISYTFSIH